MATRAYADLEKGLKVVDGILRFVKEGKGKPSSGERALFAAGVVFLYGVWENYIEQLAVEPVKTIAEKIDPAKVPESVRKELERKSTWELVVSPGWRKLWVEMVKEKAVGKGDGHFGLNTAKARQVQSLLAMVGIENALEKIDKSIVPKALSSYLEDDDKSEEVVTFLDELVELRGEIVHTGSVPDILRKRHVKGWRIFIEKLAKELDDRCIKQRETMLTGK